MDTYNYIGESAIKDKPEKRYIIVLKEGSVTTGKLAEKSVTSEKISEEAVETSNIKDEGVTSAKIANSSVTTEKLADENITTEKLKDSAVETAKIANQNVTTEKIKDEAIDNSKLAESSVSYDKIQDLAVITEKLSDKAVTTVKVEDKAVTNPKLGDSAVDSRVLREGNVQTKHIANDSITTDKVATKAITNDKIANDTLTLEKLDPDLRDSIKAATGLPEDLLQKIQDITEDIEELKDSEFPIVLSLSTSNDSEVNNTIVKYAVTVKGEPCVPDTLELRKNNSLISNAPKASDTITSFIQANREQFTLAVTKHGKTGKQTSQTRYLCYYGGNANATISSEVIGKLTKKTSSNVSFNPRIVTKNGEYIWLIVPSYLSITKVSSSGFEVPLATPQTYTSELGDFKAYRTVNSLTDGNWNLTIE